MLMQIEGEIKREQEGHYAKTTGDTWKKKGGYVDIVISNSQTKNQKSTVDDSECN